MRDSTVDELWRVQKRIERLHELGFDVAEMDVVADEEGQRLHVTPRVVESVAASVGRLFVELPGPGHLPQWEDPALLATALRRVLASAG